MTQAVHTTHFQLHRSGARDLIWPASISAVLLLGIASGGSSEAGSAAFVLFRLLCVLLLAAALLRLRRTQLALGEQLAASLAALAVMLVGLHLVPLPFGVFASLPGRDSVATVFSVAGIPQRWMPLTLSPEATWACLLALVPPLSIFFASLAVGSRARWMIAGTILLGAAANVLLGLAQRFQGAESNLYLYELVNFGLATGFFSNRNNFAMLLCVAIPIIWAVGFRLSRGRDGARLLVIAGSVVMMAVVFIGLAVSGSRSGILLGMLALALSTVMVWSPSASSRRYKRTRLLALLGAALIVGQFGMIGLMRIAEIDPVAEYRTQIAKVTLRAAASYLPVGSGFGTFQSVYAAHETPATILSNYVNHAHNDWLELWLEGGLPAALLMAVFVLLFLVQALRVWNPRGPYAPHVLPRAASIGVLVLLLHSLAEYPLRMPALACIFALLLAIMLSSPIADDTTKKRTSNRPHDSTPEPPVSAPLQMPPRFKVAGKPRLVERRPTD